MIEQRRRRIALLDDSPTVRALVTGLLDTAGYEVNACATWPELKAALRAAPVDLVLLDVEMPDVVGDHIGYVIKRGHASWRVVYLSDHDEKTLRAMCDRTGVDGFIRKSADPAELLRAIEAQLPDEDVRDPPAGG